jgi:predicted dehydrogenase
MEPLRAAVIGVGNMGQNHARIYAQMPDVELVALVDKEKSRGSMVAKKFGVPRAYTSVAQLLRHEAIDVASIALPPQQNPRATMGLMQKGVHLLVEKPFTTTIADAKQMIARAQKAGVTVAVGYTEHFNPAVRAAKQVIERGTLGTIRFIRAQRIGVPTPRIRNVHIVLDIGVHDIEVIQYLVGRRPTRLHAVGRRVFDRGTDIATLDLEYGPVLASTIRYRPSRKGPSRYSAPRGCLRSITSCSPSCSTRDKRLRMPPTSPNLSRSTARGRTVCASTSVSRNRCS